MISGRLLVACVTKLMSFESTLFVFNRINLQYFSSNAIVPLKANYRNSAFPELIEHRFFIYLFLKYRWDVSKHLIRVQPFQLWLRVRKAIAPSGAAVPPAGGRGRPRCVHWPRAPRLSAKTAISAPQKVPILTAKHAQSSAWLSSIHATFWI